MISDHEKREAWIALSACVALGEIRWLAPLSQEQKDCLLTGIGKKFNPGKARPLGRWGNLYFAFEVLKGRQPDKSNNKIYEAVAKHYDNQCHWTTVRKARLKMRQESLSAVCCFKRNGYTSDDFARHDLPHINFDNFPDE